MVMVDPATGKRCIHAWGTALVRRLLYRISTKFAPLSGP